MAKVLMGGTGGDDEGVVIDDAVAENHLALSGVNVDGFAEQNLGIFLFAQHLAQRASDVGRRKRTRRHLIEQRLKKVIVATVDQGDLDRRVFEFQRGSEAAETATQNYHFMRIHASEIPGNRLACYSRYKLDETHEP